jgi:hypothetical protein
MPKSRAHKEAMGHCGVVKKEGVSNSAPGPANVHAKNKQYNVPKDVAAVGPHYPQDEPQKGVSMKGGLK